MHIDYTVHSVHRTTYQTPVTLPDGAEVQGSVEGLIVELVSADGSMGHIVRVPPHKAEDAAEIFIQGAAITATFAPTPAPAEKDA